MASIPVRGRHARRKAVLSAHNTLVFAIGAYLQHARIARGLDQGDVAAAANIDQSYVSSIENGGWDESGDNRVRAYLEHVGIPNQNALLTLTQTMSKLRQDLLDALV